MDVLTHFFLSDILDIHFNHGLLLEAIWSWVGISAEHRQRVAEVYLFICLCDFLSRHIDMKLCVDN